MFGQSYVVINQNGGASANLDDGLKMLIEPNGEMFVYRRNRCESWATSDALATFPSHGNEGVRLTFRFQRGSTINTTPVQMTVSSITSPAQTGNVYTSSIAGYVTSPISQGRFYVTIEIKYEYPQQYFTVDYYVRAPINLPSAETINLYLDHDTYILGNDNSRGYRSGQIASTEYRYAGIYREAGDSGTPNGLGAVSNTSSCYKNKRNALDPASHGFKTDATGFSSSANVGGATSAGNVDSRRDVNSTNKLSGTFSVNCHDGGLAVHFTIPNLSAGQTGVRRVMHCYGRTKTEFDNLEVISPPIPAGTNSPVKVSFTSATFGEPEGSDTHDANAIKITVSEGKLLRPEVCNFTVTAGTAVENTNYTYQKGFIIPAGDYTNSPQTFTLNNIHIIGNTVCESDKTLSVSVDYGIYNDLIELGAISTTTYTIEDDDTPHVYQVPDAGPYCPGETVLLPRFAGVVMTGASWTSSNPAVGLSVTSGTSDIPEFIATNTTNAEIFTTITVTPHGQYCDGPQMSFKVKVHPKFTGGLISIDQSICSGRVPQMFTGQAASGGNVMENPVYTWQKSTDNVNFNDIPGTNDTYFTETVPLTQTTYYRRKATNCGNTAYSNTITVTINPIPVLDNLPDIIVDAGTVIPKIQFTGNNVSANTRWTSSTTAIGLAAAGQLDYINSFTAQNNTEYDCIVDSIIVTPVSNFGCEGAPDTFLIYVYPLPKLLDRTNVVQEYMMCYNHILTLNFTLETENNLINLADSVISGPHAGELISVNDRQPGIIYRHTGFDPATRLHNSLEPYGIDSFTVKITAKKTIADEYVTTTAKVYIYVLQATSVNSDCRFANHKVTLKSFPPGGVDYYWYDRDGLAEPGNKRPNNVIIPDSPGDYYTMVQTDIIAGPYASMDFPMVPYEVRILGSSNSPVSMTWTGQVDSLWNNPANWVVEENGHTMPAEVGPSPCTNVTIPGTAYYFPELADTAECLSITMKDRAMLKNPHVLGYNEATVEIKLKPSERDRFLMWSAPLEGMVSGDYGFLNSAGNVQRNGDVFMNLFQQKNPDLVTYAADVNQFTATIASENQTLELGRAFNLKVTSTSLTKDSIMKFSKNTKFITNNMQPTGPGTYNLPILQGNAPSYNNSPYTLVQIVNPYMAYLDFGKFFAANSQKINSGFYTWNGDPNDGFISQALIPHSDGTGNRYVSTGTASQQSGLIPPLQSFFVAKTSGTAVSGLTISPDFTTTAANNAEESYALLRSSVASGGVLRITVAQDDRQAYAALLYSPTATSASDREDMPVVIHDDLTLAVYSFSATNDALAINANAYFDMTPVTIGVLVGNIGEVTLMFDELETFGYKVVLLDRMLNKRTDLAKQPSYTFVATKPGEINDRFVLEMVYTGSGIVLTDVESIPRQTFFVSTDNGGVRLRSAGEKIRSFDIYDMLGRVAYREEHLNVVERYVSLPPSSIYLVKARVGDEIFMEKFIIK
jgi:hypothetical protein